MINADKEKVFVKKTNCPNCGKNLDSAVCSDASDERPRKGDFSICFACLMFLKFDKNLNLKKVDLNKLSKKDKLHLLEMKEKLILAKKWYSELH
jgi:hypothetical protein